LVLIVNFFNLVGSKVPHKLAECLFWVLRRITKDFKFSKAFNKHGSNELIVVFTVLSIDIAKDCVINIYFYWFLSRLQKYTKSHVVLKFGFF
jgi:hypothetical protein